MKNKRVLVTGGAGFIGSNLVDALVAADARVVVIDDMSTGSRANLADASASGVTLHEGSILDRDLVSSAMRDVDVVFHMAVSNLRVSLRDPWPSHDVNAGGTLMLLEEAARSSVERFVYCSSSEVYGSMAHHPLAEDGPTLPTTVYGAAKLAGEGYALAFWRTHRLPVVVARPFNTYGFREHLLGTSGEVIPKMLLRALRGQPPVVFGEGHQSRDFTFVEDTVRGLMACAETPDIEGEVFNLARGEEVQIGDLARLICKLCDVDAAPEHIEARPADVDRQWADVDKAERVLGFRAGTELVDGLERYREWFLAFHPDLTALSRSEELKNW